MASSEYPITQRVIDAACTWHEAIETHHMIRTYSQDDEVWIPAFVHFMQTVTEYIETIRELNPESIKDDTDESSSSV